MSKKIKTIICASLAAAMMVSMCGCGTGSTGSENDVKEEVTEVVTEATEETSEEPIEDFAGIENDIPELRSVMASADGLGEDAICGTCFGMNEFYDGYVLNLI